MVVVNVFHFLSLTTVFCGCCQCISFSVIGCFVVAVHVFNFLSLACPMVAVNVFHLLSLMTMFRGCC